MFFFFKKKQIVVDCFTTNLSAYRFAPIVKSVKTVPSWWKDLPNPGFGNARIYPKSNNNMRRCYGFIELFRRGFTIEHWCDMHIEVNQHQWQAGSSDTDGPVNHPSDLYKGAFENFHHMKLESPWAIRENTGQHFAWLGAEWLLDKHQFRVLPGVLEFNINRSANVNLMLPKPRDPYSIYIELGQPLVQVIPLNDDITLDVRNHLVDDNEIKKQRAISPSFKGFNALKKLASRNEAREKMDKKCPFNFKK